MPEMAAVKAAAQSRDPTVTGDPPNQEPGEAVVVWTPPTRAKTNANPLEQSSSNPPLMPEMAAVEAAAPSRDPPTLGDPPNQKPGEAIVAWTPPTTPCTLGQSNSNPSLQMVATKRKALDQEEEAFSANKAARIEEAEPEEAVVVWKPPTTRATSKRNSTEKWISAVKPIHTKKKPPMKKKLQNKRLPSDDNKKKQF
jgi:hypothetical protein